MKEETLEEISKHYANTHQDVSLELGKYLVSAVFQDGAKWQQQNSYSEEPKPTIKQVDYVAKKQEIMYSEEEVLDILREFYKISSKKDFPLTNTIPLWFEQYKKK